MSGTDRPQAASLALVKGSIIASYRAASDWSSGNCVIGAPPSPAAVPSLSPSPPQLLLLLPEALSFIQSVGGLGFEGVRSG